MGAEILYLQCHSPTQLIEPRVNYDTLNSQKDVQRALNILVAQADRTGTLNCLDALALPAILEEQAFYAQICQAAARVLGQETITTKQLYELWVPYSPFN